MHTYIADPPTTHARPARSTHTARLARLLPGLVVVALALVLFASSSALGAQGVENATARAAGKQTTNQRYRGHQARRKRHTQRNARHRAQRVRRGAARAHPHRATSAPIESLPPTSASPGGLIPAMFPTAAGTVASGEAAPAEESLPSEEPSAEPPSSVEPPATEEPAAPANTLAPSIGGKTVEGETLSAAAGAWSPEPSSLEYQWQQCNAAGEECVNVSEATSSTYELAESDVGATVRVAVTASDRGGSGRAWSPPSRTVVPPAPTNVVSPTIAGRAMEGETLQAGPGTWSHEPTAYAYQWESCNGRGELCASIAGATSSEYRIGTGEADHRLRVAVTATNAGGSAQASSLVTSMVEAAEPPTQPPVDTALPAVSGTAEEGRTLTASPGTWTGSPTSYAYQWQDCNSLGEACSNIAGATASTRVLTASDVGHTLRVVVTAANAGGTAEAASVATASIVAEPPPTPAPTNSVLPAVSGTAEEGKTLTASTGTWTGSPTAYAYQWEDCNSSGASCSAIGGATASTRVLASSDVGHTLRVVVKATNAGGSGEATSAATATVVAEPPAAPTNSVLPAVSGTAEEGKTLSASTGTWTGSPTAYAYQWEDCNSSGASCSAIGGATASTRVLASSDVGHTLRVVVTATNAGGSGEAVSAATATVVAEPPAAPTNSVLPAVSGTAEEGKTLTASTGTWTGSPTAYAYQWEDCNSSGASCSAIGGATASTRVLASSDVGHTLRVVVKATNAGGSGEAVSAASGTVVAEPPAAPTNSVLPSVSGTAEEGKTLTASTGTWTGSPSSYAYQWEDCNSSGASCSAISGATASTRVLAPSDVGHTLKVVVKATNAGGSGEAVSAATATVIADPPSTGNEEELHPNPKDENCFENPETEGTSRIERCGYPGQKNVGVETCSALGKSSSSKTITTGNETIENTDITGGVVIDASNVTLNHDCVIASGEAAIKVESGGTTFTIANSTIRGENATTGRIEFGLASEYPEGGAATKDRLEDCEECVHGWKWTVKESFVFANGELKNPAIHREDWFNNRGWVIADDDTMLNPETQTAIVFSEDSGIPCENEMTIENSLFAGSGYMFQNCAHASGSGPGKFVFKGNRIARCTGKLVHGEGNYCEGPDRESPESGFDANGYFPDGGYYGIYGTCEACTSAGLTWEDNYWDNNLEPVS